MGELDSKELTYETDRGEVRLTPHFVRAYLVSGSHEVSDKEVIMFLNLCKYQKLNPFLKEAYLIKYNQSDPAQMVVSKEVFQKRAAEFELFDGMKSGVIVITKDGEMIEREGTFTLPDDREELVGAWAIGWRKDQDKEKKVTVALHEYVGKKRDGTITKMWATKTGTMIVKVAESQLLRAIIPERFQGLYSSEEMNLEATVEREPIKIEDAPDQANDRRSYVSGLIEDNRGILGDDYCEACLVDIDAAGTIEEIDSIGTDLAQELSKVNKAEANERRKEFVEEMKTLPAEDAIEKMTEPELDIF